MRAWNAHDRERVRALLPDDFYLDDRRRTGVGRLDGADAYVASLDAMWDLSRDLRIETLYFDRIAAHGRLYVARWSGTNAEGGEFDAVYVCLGLANGDRPAGLEIFELDAPRRRARALRGAALGPAGRAAAKPLTSGRRSAKDRSPPVATLLAGTRSQVKILWAHHLS